MLRGIRLMTLTTTFHSKQHNNKGTDMNNLDEITFKVDGKDIPYVRKDSVAPLQLPTGDFAPYEIGEQYHVETVTKYFLGELVNVTDKELCFIKCSWVEDTGRYNKYVSGNAPNTNEPFPRDAVVIIGRGAIVSCVKRPVIFEVK